MSLKKTFSLLIGGILSLSLLTGCGASAPQADSDSASAGDSLSFVDYTRQGDGGGFAAGYYRLVPRADGSNNICFVDYQTRLQTFLCNRPECRHQDDTCPSWFPCSASGGTLFVSGGHLFYLSFGNRNPDIVASVGEDALPQLIQMDLSGAGREVLHIFSASDLIREGIVYDSSAIYFTCDSFENFEQNGNLPQRSLYQYDLGAKKLTKLKSLTINDQIIGACKREVILSAAAGAEDLSNAAEDLENTISCYNVDTGAEYTVLTHPFVAVGRVSDGYYYLYDPTTTALSRVNLSPGAQQEVIKKEVFGEAFLSYPYEVKAVFDHHLFVMYEIPKNEEWTDYSTSLQAIDLATGKARPITIRVKKSGGLAPAKEVEIVDELEDQFLVISSVEYYDVALPLDGGSVNLPYPYFHYSLIEKQDYYSSDPNYIPIEIMA